MENSEPAVNRSEVAFVSRPADNNPDRLSPEASLAMRRRGLDESAAGTTWANRLAETARRRSGHVNQHKEVSLPFVGLPVRDGPMMWVH